MNTPSFEDISAALRRLNTIAEIKYGKDNCYFIELDDVNDHAITVRWEEYVCDYTEVQSGSISQDELLACTEELQARAEKAREDTIRAMELARQQEADRRRKAVEERERREFERLKKKFASA